MSQLTKNTTDLDALITKANALPEAVDTSDADATADDIVSPRTAYVNGEKVTGNIPSKSSSDLTVSGATVNVPAGHYKQAANKAVPTATQATPSISVSSSGLITASATQSAGYVAAGTKSGTKQLTTQAAKTVTPTTSEQTVVAAGRYTTGAVKVAKIPDSYIQPSGTKSITENGTHDVKNYASVNVNVAGSGGGGVEYEIITIPKGATSATYTLPRVTNAFGSLETYVEDFDGIAGVTNSLCQYFYNYGSDTFPIYYNRGTISWMGGAPTIDTLTLILVNDPNKNVLYTCTPS